MKDLKNTNKRMKGDVMICSLMGMGNDHICTKFDEQTCMLCQLRNMYNNLYSMIVNNLDITYMKEPGVFGLYRRLTPKKGLSVEHKEAIRNKLVELINIRILINKTENDN